MNAKTLATEYAARLAEFGATCTYDKCIYRIEYRLPEDPHYITRWFEIITGGTRILAEGYTDEKYVGHGRSDFVETTQSTRELLESIVVRISRNA